METMVLVAGLAVAGLVGIAAAFYFSIRSAGRRDKRMRAAATGRADVGRNPGSRADTTRPNRTIARRVAGPGGPGAPAGRRAGARAGNARAGDARAGDARAGDARARDARAGDARARDARAGDARARELAGARRMSERPEPAEQAWPEDSWPDDAWPDHPAAQEAWPEDPTAEEAWPQDPVAGGSRAESRPAARLSREAHAAEIAAKADKPRRRVGFRKGADLDEELWPAETFGGVSDEQFWDDLASDKPLTTTARTAEPATARMPKPAPTGRAPKPEAATARLAAKARLHKPEAATARLAATARSPEPEAATARLGKPEPAGAWTAQREAGTRSLPVDTGQATDPQVIQAPRGGRRGAGSGPYPSPRTAPDPAAERTAIQSAYGATQPVSATPPQGMATPPQGMATPPQGTATPPQGTSIQPREGRRRRPSSSEEDPLTSAAFALRPSGPVDGRSALRARNRNQDPSGTGSDPVSGGSYGNTPPHPYATPSYGGQSPVTETMNTPPYGENYGYANGHGAHGAHAAPADRPRRAGTGSYQGTHQAPGSQPGTSSHQATDSHQGTGGHQGTGSNRTGSYSTGSYQGTGSYPAGGAYPGNGYSGNGHQRGGYPGNGHLGNGNGHRAPYDPRDDYRRLGHQHLAHVIVCTYPPFCGG
jgi:hypothetical protein